MPVDLDRAVQGNQDLSELGQRLAAHQLGQLERVIVKRFIDMRSELVRFNDRVNPVDFGLGSADPGALCD